VLGAVLLHSGCRAFGRSVFSHNHSAAL